MSIMVTSLLRCEVFTCEASGIIRTFDRVKVDCVQYSRVNRPRVQDYESKCNNNVLTRIKPTSDSGWHVPAANNTRRQCKYPIYSELQPACVAIINFGAGITRRRDGGNAALFISTQYVINNFKMSFVSQFLHILHLESLAENINWYQ